MASLPFLSFRFLQGKNLKIYTAGLHAGRRFGLSEFHFVKLQELRHPCRQVKPVSATTLPVDPA
jgi:hypothetical protein